MALLWADGFDDYDYDASFATDPFSGEYDRYVDNNDTAGLDQDKVDIVAGEGRRGTNCVKFTGNNNSILSYFQKRLPEETDELFVALATKIPGIGGGVVGGTLCTFFSEDSSSSSGTRQVTVSVTTAGAIRAHLGLTLLGASADGVVADTNYHHYQIRAVFDDTAGVVQVKLDGSTSFALNLTGVDTNNGVNSTANSVRIGFSSTGSHTAAQPDQCFDDIVIWDTTGSLMNGWVGDIRVDTYFPDGEGDEQDFTTSSGADHYVLVDEANPDNTDYVESSGYLDVELFNIEDMSHNPGTIYGVMPTVRALKDDSGSRSIFMLVRSGLSTYTSGNDGGSDLALVESSVFATGAKRHHHVFEFNPGTSGVWTKSAFNVLQTGVKVLLDEAVSVTTLWNDEFAYANETDMKAAYDQVVDTGSGSDDLTFSATEGRSGGGCAKFVGTNDSILSYFQKKLPPHSTLTMVTGDATNNTFSPDLGSPGDIILVVSLIPGEGTGLVVGRTYFSLGDQLSTTFGGSAVDFTTDITDGTFEIIGYESLYVGLATKIPTLRHDTDVGSVGGTLCTFMSADVPQVVVSVTDRGAIQAHRNLTLIGSGDDNVIDNTGYHYYEIFALFSNSGGIVRVKVDGSTDYALDLTNVDTNNDVSLALDGKGIANGVRIGWETGVGDHKAAQPDQCFDDFEIWEGDGAGATWRGDMATAGVNARIAQHSVRVASRNRGSSQPHMMVIQ
jgi:hypothetical protein